MYGFIVRRTHVLSMLYVCSAHVFLFLFSINFDVYVSYSELLWSYLALLFQNTFQTAFIDQRKDVFFSSIFAPHVCLCCCALISLQCHMIEWSIRYWMEFIPHSILIFCDSFPFFLLFFVIFANKIVNTY